MDLLQRTREGVSGSIPVSVTVNGHGNGLFGDNRLLIEDLTVKDRQQAVLFLDI